MNDNNENATNTPVDAQASTSPLPSPSPVDDAPPAAPTPTADTPALGDAGITVEPHHPILSGMIVILEGMTRQIEKEFSEIADAIRVVITKIKAHIK